MDSYGASRLVELLSYGVLLLAVTILAHKSLVVAIRLSGCQGVLLGAVTAVVARHVGDPHLYFVAALAVLIKGIAIPTFFYHVMKRLDVPREERSMPAHVALLVTGALTLFAHHVSRPVALSSPWLTRDILASSLATVLIGIAVMITCRRALTQMLGFLVVEDGIFLFALTETYGMPLLVELGIFFDLMVTAGVTGILVLRISGSFNHIDVGELSELKG